MEAGSLRKGLNESTNTKNYRPSTLKVKVTLFRSRSLVGNHYTDKGHPFYAPLFHWMLLYIKSSLPSHSQLGEIIN